MASPVDTSVKFAHADMPGAPVLSGTAGAMISVLDAFLVTGFGLKAADSGGTIAGGVCRIPFSSGASAVDKNAVILVAGAAPAGLNGEQKVTNFSSSWVEFKTSLPDGPVTGSVTFKIAPLGWEKVYSKTNVAVYRPTDPSSTRPYLRVDDADTMLSRVTVYEAMTDVDTGFNRMPATTNVANGYHWWKRTTAGAQAMQYALVGDSCGVYVAPMPSQNAGTMGNKGFTACYAGDLKSYRSGDAYCGLLTGGNTSGADAGNSAVYGNVFVNEAATMRTIMRRANGIGSAQTCERTAYGSTTSGFDGTLGVAPAPANNGLYMTPILVSDGGTLAINGVRGELPGALCSIQTGLPAAVGQGIGQLAGTGEYAGKTLLRLQIANRVDGGASQLGTGFFDITGPWRN